MKARALTRALYVFLAVGIPLLGGCLDRELKPLNPCLVSGVVAEIAVTNVDKVDMLFMVDNSGSMREEQDALRREFPRLIRTLTEGDRDLDGMQDFPPAKDLHLGVVSSDLGLVGIQGIPLCDGLGDDGIMNNLAGPNVANCQPSYPRFLSYIADVSNRDQTAVDFSCIADLGTEGCGFEQQLESPLKALWPINDPRITFLGDVNGFGTTGQGGDMTTGAPNAGFLRNDPTQGLSLIAIVVVSDEEDCSSANTVHFTPDTFLQPNDPLRMQGLNTRCFRNKQNLYEVQQRYVDGFKALRPGNENLVVFAGIVGVPPTLVEPEDLAAVDFTNEAARNNFYDQILADPNMMETLDDRGTPEVADDNLRPSCDTATGRAYPPRRIVETIRGFGANGVLQSICQSSFSGAVQAIIDVIAKQLGAVCLPRPLIRDSEGLVGCNVVWELPPANTAPAATPVNCGAPNFEFLLPPDPGRDATTDNGGAVCKVAQLAVTGSGADKMQVPTDNNGIVFSEGWYYDDFSDEVVDQCTGETKQRVAFSPQAKPPTGVTVKLECLNETQSLANTRTDVMQNVEQPAIGDPCQDVMLRGQPATDDAACIVKLADNTDDTRLYCHDGLNVCVLSCSTDADCPAAWVCDSRPDTLISAGPVPNSNPPEPRPYCVNPTCGDGK